MSTNPLPAELMEQLPDELKNFEPKATICNIFPDYITHVGGDPVIPVLRTYAQFYVKCPKMHERYALTEVTWKTIYFDKGDSIFGISRGPQHSKMPFQDNRIRSVQGARGIADDICQDLNGSDGPEGFWGKFVCTGEKPTEHELKTNEEKLKNYLLTVVDKGVAEWSKNPSHQNIDGRCKRAASFLGLKDLPWMSESRAQTNCIACMEPIIKGAILCKHCHTRQDAEGLKFLEIPKQEIKDGNSNIATKR